MAKRERVARPEGDLAVKLRDLIEHLQRSCRDYDEGHWNEAPRLSLAIRQLFYDEGSGRSLLRQMNLKKSLRMENAAMTVEQFNADQAPRPGETPGTMMVSQHLTQRPGLVWPAVGPGRAIWSPRFDVHPPTAPVGVDYWWNDPVSAGDEGRTYSRCDLVLGMANQDGGAHVDEKLDEMYAHLLEDTHGHLFGFGVDPASVSGEGFAPPENTIVHASMRQIAYEVLVTFERDLHAYTV